LKATAVYYIFIAKSEHRNIDLKFRWAVIALKVYFLHLEMQPA